VMAMFLLVHVRCSAVPAMQKNRPLEAVRH
jgi:hypothetical protein